MSGMNPFSGVLCSCCEEREAETFTPIDSEGMGVCLVDDEPESVEPTCLVCVLGEDEE